MEHRLVTFLVLLGMTAGFLTIATSLAARFSAIGRYLLP
jgi:Flp pilus assembly pilin Flp